MQDQQQEQQQDYVFREEVEEETFESYDTGATDQYHDDQGGGFDGASGDGYRHDEQEGPDGGLPHAGAEEGENGDAAGMTNYVVEEEEIVEEHFEDGAAGGDNDGRGRSSTRGSKGGDYEGRGRRGGRSLCSCPYGPLVLVPTFWIAAALMCTFYAGFECTFFQVHGLFKREATVTYGLWTVEDYENSKVYNQEVYLSDLHVGTANSCSTWSKHAELTSEDVDGALSFARVCILIAGALGTLSLFWIIGSWWRRYSTRTVYIFSVLMVLAAVFTALSFYALKSDYCDDKDCELDFAGYIAIVAVVFWLFATCAAMLMRSGYVTRPENFLVAFSRSERN